FGTFCVSLWLLFGTLCPRPAGCCWVHHLVGELNSVTHIVSFVSQGSKFLGNPCRALPEYQVQTNFVAASFQAQDFELLAASGLRIVCIDTRYMRTYTV